MSPHPLSSPMTRLLGYANKFLSLVRVGVIRRVWIGSGLTKPVYHKESLTFSDKCHKNAPETFQFPFEKFGLQSFRGTKENRG